MRCSRKSKEGDYRRIGGWVVDFGELDSARPYDFPTEATITKGKERGEIFRCACLMEIRTIRRTWSRTDKAIIESLSQGKAEEGYPVVAIMVAVAAVVVNGRKK